MSRAVLAALAALALLAPAAEARTALQRSLSGALSGAGRASGAYVFDAQSRKTLYASRSTTPRVLASNTKLFTSAALLGRLGEDAKLATTVVGDGTFKSDGTWRGSIYLRGGGDPTFGDRKFNRGYGSGANVEAIATALHKAGFKRITGRVYGDETLFDSRRGVPDSGWHTSPWVGPLSGLDFDHGYGGGGFLAHPALYAAQKLDLALQARGIKVGVRPDTKAAPDGAVSLAEVRSPSVARLLRLQNKVSDNFFAEMLAKGLAVSGRSGAPARQPSDPLPVPPEPGADASTATPATPLPGPATTTAGARVVARFARTLGANPHLVDGSGLTRSNRASPRSVGRLLYGMSRRPDFGAYFDSLPVAGRDGTLDNRMRHGMARGRCHAKTGTLTNVSALSGYCNTRGGHLVVFSILMNGVNVYSAHNMQDRMAQAIARYKG